jgi:Putative transmembrane protein (PGPGW)
MEDARGGLSCRRDILAYVSVRSRVVGAARRTALEVVGWTLVAAGIAMLALPGPGLLTVVAGLVVLSQQYDWAKRQLGPIKVQAYRAAREGVETWPRIIASALAACVVMGMGVLVIVRPDAPDWFPLDEQWWLPGGLVGGVSIIVSGLIGLGLLAYSVRRFRYTTVPGVEDPVDPPPERGDGPGKVTPGRP